MIGWIVYAVGFIWLLPEHNQSSINFPYYIILAGGPTVFLLGVLHAILPGVCSAFLWIVLALISVLHSLSVGWAIYASGLWLTSKNPSPSSIGNLKDQTEFIFTGSLLSVISWALVLILAVYYQTGPSVNGNRNYNEFQRQRQRIQLPFSPGKARKFAIPLTSLSCVGWILFLLGYWIWRPESDIEKPEYYVDLHSSSGQPVIVVLLVITPLLYLASFIHAASLGGAGKVARVFESIFSVLFMVSMGTAVIQQVRYFIYVRDKDATELLNRDFFLIMLIGGVLSLLFWALVLALWPFYGEYTMPPGAGNGRRNVIINDRAPAPAREGHTNYGAVPVPVPRQRAQRRLPRGEQPLIGENGQQ